MGFQIKPKEALILEGIELCENKRRRTLDAIGGTYKSEFGSNSVVEGRGRVASKPFTKSRRKLPNGRKWKDKTREHAELRTEIVKDRFNDKELHRKTMNKIYKSNSESRSIADAIVRGDDEV